VKGRLAALGVDDAQLERIHAPIGLDINAETLEEIAVSILGEIIRLRGVASGR
jgi:xanthine dehydrogenase accessory factor